jgi:hypothetical protein
MKRFFKWLFWLVVAALVTFLIVREVNYDKWYSNETTTEVTEVTVDTLMVSKDSIEVSIDTLNTINTAETNE